MERATDRYTVIGKNLFKKETNLQAFANLKVCLSSGEKGVIEGGFGQSGKVKIRCPGEDISSFRAKVFEYVLSCSLFLYSASTFI